MSRILNKITKGDSLISPMKEVPKVITVALAGNPNSGKTTIFNCLTGSHQHVGNYPGVTVEVKEGYFEHRGRRVRVIDLPGTYSLSAYSREEVIACDFLLRQRPDTVVNIVDGSNLERNLYLTVQLREMGLPVIVAMNMADEMKSQGIEADRKLLGEQLGATVVATIGTRKRGIEKLKDAILESTGRHTAEGWHEVDYGPEIQDEQEKLTAAIRYLEKRRAEANISPDLTTGTDREEGYGQTGWVAMKLLENDRGAWDYIEEGSELPAEIEEQMRVGRLRMFRLFGEEAETLIAERRYGYVHGLCQTAVRRSTQSRINMTDVVDRVLTHRVLGLPIFAAMMYASFWLVFAVGEYPMGWIERGFGWLSGWLAGVWPADHAEWLRSLLADGIIGGVGGVLVFVPNIVLLFTAITILEDTGYMARAAFIVDRVMKAVGLHGKSFIPMLTGFGCSVPAIMGTRILENRRDRLTTILVLPLISCGARLPIYMLIIPAFFSPRYSAMVMYSLYIIGIVLAMLCAKLLRKTVFRGDPTPFVMELPPYRIPTPRAVMIHVWQRTRMYLRKAGTVILGISVAMWAITSYPKLPQERQTQLTESQHQTASLEYSVTGRVGRAIEPVLRPLGFDWRIGTALIGAFAAKEVFVAQLGIVYAVGESHDQQSALREQLRANYTSLTGFCIMLFCLIATPCMATVAVARREAGGWKWAMFQFFGLTGLAYVIVMVVNLGGRLAGL